MVYATKVLSLFAAWSSTITYSNSFTIAPKSLHKYTASSFVGAANTNNRWSSDARVLKAGEEEERNEEDRGEKEELQSVALEWAKEQAQEVEEMVQQQQQQQDSGGTSSDKKKYVVIGGGWAGWGAVKALCQSQINADIILIDALPDPTGAAPYVSKSGKPVEAGTRGFWKDYPNIYALCDELGLDTNEVFTPYTNSSFYSPDGLEATAPVFSEAKLPSFPFLPESISSVLGDALNDQFPTLPSPLGQVVATSQLFERIPLADRASMGGLLLATIDCLGGDEETKEAYDRMTAHDLFLKFRLSSRLVSDFIKPTLLVGLFKPPEELSALVVMELLYYYALAHQDSFDVRWIRNGTVADSLIAPLAHNLMDQYSSLQVLPGSFVKTVSLEEDDRSRKKASKLTYTKRNPKDGTVEETAINNIDGIILSVGCKGMRSIVSSSPDLAKLQVFADAASLQGIDVISARLWLDRTVETRTPANVFSRFDSLRGAGGTFFMLDQFQEPNKKALWNIAAEEKDDVSSEGSVVACDFYNAGSLIHLPDDDIVDILMNDLLPSAVPRFADAKLVDSWVGKYQGAVSWFSPGSYALRPPLEGAGNDILPNIKCAGDWVKMGVREHGAKGLCQERAFVSGIEAANSLLQSTLSQDQLDEVGKLDVLPVREDEIQFQMAVKANNIAMKYIPRFWVR